MQNAPPKSDLRTLCREWEEKREGKGSADLHYRVQTEKSKLPAKNRVRGVKTPSQREKKKRQARSKPGSRGSGFGGRHRGKNKTNLKGFAWESQRGGGASVLKKHRDSLLGGKEEGYKEKPGRGFGGVRISQT